MISAGEFRNGVIFELDGNVFKVIEFQHVKPGKGAAFVRTKLRNVITGAVLEKTFNPTDKMPKAQIDVQDMQYLYNDGELYYFMNTESYEQLPIQKEILEESLPYLKDNTMVRVLSFKGSVYGVEAPNFVELEVTYTEPGFSGNTSTGSTKPATVETGATFNVPLFINIGDVIRIDTRVGEYMERVN